jgi:phage terminase small subunit
MLDVKRGRVSAAARSVAATMATMENDLRPEPPKNLDAREAQVWRDTVNSMEPDWFPPETHVMLAQYCKHCAGLDYLDKVIADLKKKPQTKVNVSDVRKMINVRRQESKIIAHLATKMRLAQQSSYNRNKVNTVRRKAKAAASEPISPWS